MSSIAGISMPNSGLNDGALVIETIGSRRFLSILLEHDDILPSLVVAQSYDATNKELVFDDSVYDKVTGNWVSDLDKPSLLEAYKEYKKIVTISQDKKSGFITISTEHLSPIFAKDFGDLIIHELNSLIRKKELEESQKALTFLKEQISLTSLIEIKTSINQLIQVQIMANIKEDYIIETIEPPFIAEEKIKPQRLKMLLIGLLVGIGTSISYVLLKGYFVYHKKF